MLVSRSTHGVDMGTGTSHELHDMLMCLDENQLDMLRVALFQFLLQVATAMLVFAKIEDLALKML